MISLAFTNTFGAFKCNFVLGFGCIFQIDTNFSGLENAQIPKNKKSCVIVLSPHTNTISGEMASVCFKFLFISCRRRSGCSNTAKHYFHHNDNFPSKCCLRGKQGWANKPFVWLYMISQACDWVVRVAHPCLCLDYFESLGWCVLGFKNNSLTLLTLTCAQVKR